MDITPLLWSGTGVLLPHRVFGGWAGKRLQVRPLVPRNATRKLNCMVFSLVGDEGQHILECDNMSWCPLLVPMHPGYKTIFPEALLDCFDSRQSNVTGEDRVREADSRALMQVQCVFPQTIFTAVPMLLQRREYVLLPIMFRKTSALSYSATWFAQM